MVNTNWMICLQRRWKTLNVFNLFLLFNVFFTAVSLSDPNPQKSVTVEVPAGHCLNDEKRQAHIDEQVM